MVAILSRLFRSWQVASLLGLVMLAIGCANRQTAVHHDPASVVKLVPITVSSGAGLDSIYALRGGQLSMSRLTIDPASVPAELAAPTLTAGDTIQLRVLHINDMHHHLVDYGDLPQYRAARIAQLVEDRRDAARDREAVIFLSAGDDAAGTRFDELIGDTPKEFIMHPGYRVYNKLGLDVAVLGNHEFDWGTELLGLSVAASASFPVISSNVVTRDKNWPILGALIATAKGVRIGFLGFTSPIDIPVRKLGQRGFRILGVEKQLRKLVPLLDPYVDIFVMLDHIGFDGSSPEGQPRHYVKFGDTRVARLLATLTPKPAIIVGGHTHTILNKDGLAPGNVIAGIPVLQAGSYGQWLGEVVIALRKGPEALAATYTAHLISTEIESDSPDCAGCPIDLNLQRNVIAPMEHRIAQRFDQVIGVIANDPELSFSKTAIDRYTGESTLMNLMTDAVVRNSPQWPAGQIDFSALNATSLSAGFTPGADLSYGAIYKVFPYADTIYILRLSGRQIRAIIENNARRLWQRAQFRGGGGKLDATQYNEHGFLHFSSGIRYTIVVDKKTGLFRAKNIRLHDIPVAKLLSKQFTLALPGYLAIGRGRWNGGPIGGGRLATVKGMDLRPYVAQYGYDTGLIWRKEILAYIKRQGGNVGPRMGAVKDGRLVVKPVED